ncbi:excinuclease ABC subunit C [Candidatus Gottesmanbacteria bacterium RIFCSPLOWO2_02_FULL_42_29]|uniref:Excinuclease ABC subunit C n=2 Tax=Candidatus Gottesmaniibacteriota TaxID=1752720 RepID=A0A1F6BFD2_9BACT|nr:MAG: hypothetical protein UV09_C0031G0014 [Candidatus Gottesmanbacteria bacterium GW2011_GWA2_42_18]KKS73517.1 MAG: hypothetical protein UV46_C0072G0011 [Candidatus Gottesmanbacteria bacterium GW2011_GWC2_42_8]OGG12097.1 MAG: excinuclease ABC subunit C [Candidatus Gottesmanbacteria bacterium RIFCSPHIGHO2_01_FULL_42_27]OGG20450.1 MAG: excinuclease ABC subunit C [Candidatus Gottesmanbacteria bacterium RIFCSPHIGHO2_12_FULL_43_26]OGG34341.1 MAG: excinuclease ABC subunit C [Candidatus Gottesmanba
MQKYYCVYIITNSRNTVLYTGVTGNLIARIYDHKNKSVSSFSSKYNLEKLVYYEIFDDINIAIEREKQIKAGNRQKKIELIASFNPDWKDLYSTILQSNGIAASSRLNRDSSQ